MLDLKKKLFSINFLRIYRYGVYLDRSKTDFMVGYESCVNFISNTDNRPLWTLSCWFCDAMKVPPTVDSGRYMNKCFDSLEADLHASLSEAWDFWTYYSLAKNAKFISKSGWFENWACKAYVFEYCTILEPSNHDPAWYPSLRGQCKNINPTHPWLLIYTSSHFKPFLC